MNTQSLPSGIMEVCRSYSIRINKGNYEHEDHFCSAKMECLEPEAEELSEKLFQFSRSQVFKGISGETASEPKSIDQYAVVEVIPEPVEQSATATVNEPSRLRAMVMGLVQGSTKRHLSEYYAGWFGVENLKQVPDYQNPDLYVEPLTALLRVVELVKESHQQLTSNPRQLGIETKAAKDALQKEDQNTGVEPPKPMEGPEKKGEWSEFMEPDPLMVRYRWHKLETVQYAKALQRKYGHDDDKFAAHLKFLKLDLMPEEDLLCLMKLLFHAPDGNTLRSKAIQKKVPFKDAFAAVQKHFGQEINMQSRSADVLTAITNTISEM